MSPRATGIASGAALIAALALAGCSTSESSGAEQTPATTTVTVEATPSQQSTSTPTKDNPSSATSAPSTTAGTSPSTDETAGAGQRCDLGEPDTVGLVVQGSLTCKTLRGVWKRAVADPDFAHHGNHNRIVVDDWTCRAHQTRPVQTGFCATDDYRVKFKVIHH